jgi:hypothetical protein
VAPIRQLLTAIVQERLHEQFAAVMAARTFQSDDVAAGRAYVQAYVEFIHFAERLYDSTKATSDGHFDESGASAKDH